MPLAVSPPPPHADTGGSGSLEPDQQAGTSPAVASSPPPTPSPAPLGQGRPGLEAVLLAAAQAASARRECVPPVLTPAVATFPFAIDFLPVPAGKPGGGGGSSKNNGSFGLGAVKRLLLQASPPSVLR